MGAPPAQGRLEFLNPRGIKSPPVPSALASGCAAALTGVRSAVRAELAETSLASGRFRPRPRLPSRNHLSTCGVSSSLPRAWRCSAACESTHLSGSALVTRHAWRHDVDVLIPGGNVATPAWSSHVCPAGDRDLALNSSCVDLRSRAPTGAGGPRNSDILTELAEDDEHSDDS